MSDLTHRVEWSRAYDLRHHPSPRKYGQSGMRLSFIFIGPKGAVDLVLNTGWVLESSRDSYRGFNAPEGWGQNVHSCEPMYEGQQSIPCSYLSQGRCYCDGSSLYSEEWIEGFLASGPEWLRSKMEDLYRFHFEDGPAPDFTPQYLPHPEDSRN